MAETIAASFIEEPGRAIHDMTEGAEEPAARPGHGVHRL